MALAPLLVALSARSSARRAFGLGLLTGAVYFAGTIYWITRVMVVYGGLPGWVSALVNALLIAYLALFPAAFAVVMHRALRSLGSRALVIAPFVWVASELGRTLLFGGFPWVLLGYSQVTVLPIAQLASVLGVYGVSALVAAVASAAAAWPLSRPGARPWASTAIVALMILVVAVWGSRRIVSSELTRQGEPVRVGLVQGNVDQGLKWNPALASSIFLEYVAMTRQAIGAGAELVLWPESSTPFVFEERQNLPEADVLRNIARQSRVSILVGSDQIERGATTRYYNAAFLVRDDGKTAAVYRKMHLVPFGEFVPLKQVLFFAAPLVEAVSDFSPGDHIVLLPVGTHLISTAICYEIVYPQLVRQFVAGGSELLTTITNDAWFGTTSAPYQHFEQASMRAIEEGRYLVRSANTGISGIVDPYGRVLARTSIFEPAVTVGEARYLRTTTVYARIGDVFAYASVALSAAVLLLRRRRVQ